MAGKGKGSGSYRSAISGRYVTAKHGSASPRTTVHEAKGGGSTGSYRSAISGQCQPTHNPQGNLSNPAGCEVKPTLKPGRFTDRASGVSLG